MAWKNDQVSEKETAKILKLARECLEIEGDFVEMGCYKGDTSLILADILFSGLRCPRLYIYDSFEGLPEKGEQDESALGESFKAGELGLTKREVKQRFLKAALPVPVIKKRWFADLTEGDLPERIAFAFLDGDFYESIKDSLRLVGSRMAPGGVVVVHDYTNPALPGVRRAVDEWGGDKGKGFRLICL
jgi:O-methyltransferase